MSAITVAHRFCGDRRIIRKALQLQDACGRGMPKLERPSDGTGAESRLDFRWLMSSDVCKHCTHAGCLDVCPTGALFRTEFGTVVVLPGAEIRGRRKQPRQGHYISSVLGRRGRSKSVNSAHSSEHSWFTGDFVPA